MKLRLIALAAMWVGLAAAQQALTDDDIIRMVESGVAQDIVIRTIGESPVRFALAPAHLIAFKKAGVPDEVVRAIMTRNRELSAPKAEEHPAGAKPEVSGARPPSTGEAHRIPATPAQVPAASPGSMIAADPAAGGSIAAPELGRSRLVWEKSGATFEMRTPNLTPELDDGDDWALQRGQREVGISGGLNVGPGGFHKVQLSATFNFKLGIRRYLAAFGSYGYNDLGSAHESFYTGVGRYDVSASGRVHELVGGLRLAWPTRLAPFAEVCGGAVRATATASTSGNSVSAGINKPAVCGGAGFSFALTPEMGVNFNMRIVKASDFPWYAHTTVGFYRRF